MDTKQMITKRDAEYGSAARVMGQIVAHPHIQAGLAEMLRGTSSAYWFPWIMILNKLIRALTTPKNPDHWQDIAGYAELVLRYRKADKHG